MASESLGDAVLDLRTDDVAFDRGISRAKTKVQQLGKAFDNVGRKAAQIGRQISTFVTLPILAAGVASIKTASDVQEMRNLFRETFEASANDVEAWAARVAKATNRSRFDLMRTAADFAAFLKPLGVAPAAIVPMSEALTELTTDIASFRNQTDEEVFTRLFSGLAGETEAVRRLGIDIGQAAIEQELFNQGIRVSATEATQAQKVMARFALIMRQTTDAQGDAARTSASFENQTKALGATIKDVRVDIGQRLLPVATRAIQRIRQLGERFLTLSDNVRSSIVAIGLIVAVVGPAIVALGLLARAVGFAIAGLAFLVPVFRGVFVAFKALMIGMQAAVIFFLAFFSTVPGLIITTLALIVGSFFIFKDTIVGFFKGLIGAIKREFLEAFNNKIVVPFQESINSLVSFLPDNVTEFLGLNPIGVNEIIENSFKDDMKAVMKEAVASGKAEFEDFKNTAVNAMDVIKSTFGSISDSVRDFIPDLDLADFTLENIGQNFNDLLARLTELNNGVAGTGNAAVAAANSGSEAWALFGETVRDSMEDNLTSALTAVKKFGDAARAILNEILTAIVRIGIVRPFLGLLGLPSFGHGGRPRVGQPSIVGDRGAEIFVPDQAGRIIPNDKIGGVGGVKQEFNIGMVFPPQLEAYIRNVGSAAGRNAATQVIRLNRGQM